MSAIPKTKLTPEEYLDFERKSEERHEFFDGEIFAMSGAKRNHNVIAWNIGGELRQKLKGKKYNGHSHAQTIIQYDLKNNLIKEYKYLF